MLSAYALGRLPITIDFSRRPLHMRYTDYQRLTHDGLGYFRAS